MFDHLESMEYENLKGIRPVIIAGGEGSATHYSASFDRFMDSTLIETIYTMLQFMFEKEPVIVCKDIEKFQALPGLQKALLVKDEYGDSTLGAVRTAFAHVPEDTIFVIGSHNPFISIDTVSRMVEAQGKALAVVPMLNGIDICMHALYRRELVPIMDKKLAEGETTLHSFYREIHLVQLPIADNDKSRYLFTDIYTPEEVRYAEEKFKELRP